ncbi:MAG: hypothetical protein WC378_04460 [Opitutaceae bacterium]|jgi:hypothetical protein
MITSIKQKTISIELSDDQKVVVRRMPWKAAVELLKKLSGHIGSVSDLVKPTEDGSGASKVSVSAVIAKIPDLIMGAEDLVQHLVLNSTSLNKEAFDALDLAQASAVIEAAVELNLGDELKNSWAGIAEKIRALSAMKTKSTASATPTS